jgi:hypothetical protein
MKTSHRTLIATLILAAGTLANAQSQRPMENGAMHVQLDYMHSYDRDNVSAKGYTVSIGKRF